MAPAPRAQHVKLPQIPSPPPQEGPHRKEIRVGVHPGAEPALDAPLALLKDHDEEQRKHQNEPHDRRGRRDQEVVEERMEDDGRKKPGQKHKHAATASSSGCSRLCRFAKLMASLTAIR